MNIEKYIRVKKKECPTCRTGIGSRRLLRKDKKLQELIERLIPKLEDYQIYEQEEVSRNIKSRNKSAKHIDMMKNIQRIKERQIRAELEEKKDHKNPKGRGSNALRRNMEARNRQMVRQRTPVNDNNYRQKKRMKNEGVHHEINIKFKLKQLSGSNPVPTGANPNERIVKSKFILAI